MARKKAKTKNHFKGNSWTYEDLEIISETCEKIAKEELGLDLYPNRYEIVSYEQMLDAYTSNGLPIMYNHWSFGKKFLEEEQKYKKGNPLAYELVINSNPCINYLLESNNKTMQTLVIAHAGCGHNHFFKNNYMFKTFTDASFIFDYIKFANEYIKFCENRYGIPNVEKVLDAAHSLYFMGINKYLKKSRSIEQEQMELKSKIEWMNKHYNDVMEKTTNFNTKKEEDEIDTKNQNIIELDEENILYFLEKNSPVLENWEREILRIVRNIAQYFYPQITTKVSNEGFASFTHYYIMERLWEENYIDDGQYIEFLNYHTGVLYQPLFKEEGIVYWNPYYLGFNILMDIKRICETPDDEDFEFKPEICGKNWKETILDIVENYRDDSLVMEYLSPKIIRKMQIFSIFDDEKADKYKISSIHDNHGYGKIRKILSEHYNPIYYFPDLRVKEYNTKTNHLYIEYHSFKSMDLHKISLKSLKHLKTLWGYEVSLSIIENGEKKKEIKVN